MILASVCSVILATGVVTCEPPVEFHEARRKVEAIVEVYDPALDVRYFYLQPQAGIDVSRPLPAEEKKPVAVAQARPAPAIDETRLLNERSARGRLYGRAR